MQDIDGKDVSLSKFKGKVLLIVNVASKWYSHLNDDFAALNTCVSAKFLSPFLFCLPFKIPVSISYSFQLVIYL
jgi:glutathione peroxidase-family protein